MNQNLSLFSMLLFMVQVTVAQDAYMNLSHAGISPSATMTVEPDQEITFEYGGGGSHPMTDGHGSTPSPVFFQTVTVTSSNPIATFSLEEEGTYLFHCGTNPGNSGLWGTIIVESSTDTTVDVASGDVDMNGVMNYSDIIAMMTYFYGYATFTDEQIFEADVSLDGTITPLDLSLMKMAINGTIELPYPNEDGILDATASYELSAASFMENNEIHVPIMMSSLSNVISVDLNLTYDYSILTLNRVDFDESLGTATNIYVDYMGSLRIISANTTSSEMDFKLGDLVFTVNENLDNNTSIQLLTSETNEGGLTDEESSVEIQLLGIDNQLSFPNQFEITNVYPNPFNPSTKVTFRLDEVNDIILEIYNINGQSVRTFSNTNFMTGINSITWNGLNDMGKQVQSGVYFVKVSSGAKSISKTITLLK